MDDQPPAHIPRVGIDTLHEISRQYTRRIRGSIFGRQPLQTLDVARSIKSADLADVWKEQILWNLDRLKKQLKRRSCMQPQSDFFTSQPPLLSSVKASNFASSTCTGAMPIEHISPTNTNVPHPNPNSGSYHPLPKYDVAYHHAVRTVLSVLPAELNEMIFPASRYDPAAPFHDQRKALEDTPYHLIRHKTRKNI